MQARTSHRAALHSGHRATAALTAPRSRGSTLHQALASSLRSRLKPCQRLLTRPACSAVVEAPAKRAVEGHSALLQGLGEVGDVASVHLPWLLRLAHVKSKVVGGDSNTALQESARGLLLWKVGTGPRLPFGRWVGGCRPHQQQYAPGPASQHTQSAA
jgi:hypothetical protein